MTGYTAHHGTYLATRLMLEGRSEDAFAKNLSTARVETKPHQVDAALFGLHSPLSKWLSDPALRQRSHAGLNKGEASNALRRACSSTAKASSATARSRTKPSGRPG